jgi:hypothetical protein
MPLIPRIRQTLGRCQDGFTTVTLMGVLLVGGLIVSASFAAVNPDISLSRLDQDHKQAYGAAEAGLQWYLSRLGQDNSFYTHCTNVPPPAAEEPAPVNQRWNEVYTDPRVWRKLPGEKAQYTVELLPVTGFSQCFEGNQYSMIDPSGNMHLRISGKSRGKVRTILATLRRQNFLDFIYFTDFETLDPAAYTPSSSVTAATQHCSAYRPERNAVREASTFNCTEIQFASNDNIEGPLHTNDSTLICGSPTFGRTTRDSIEIVGEPQFNRVCGKEVVKGTAIDKAAWLGMPPSNADITNIADVNYRFTGNTTIVLNGTKMDVKNTTRFGLGNTATMDVPTNGVIYVSNKTCATGYLRQQTYELTKTGERTPTGCGDIWLKGTYSKDLTIAADNDIVINGDLKRTKDDGTLLGLVANNFVRVYHPVTFSGSNCTNKTGQTDPANNVLANPQIDAAILALNHSFIVDNWHCGDPMGNLNVFGAIAQKFRGPVGTGSNGNIASGYLKAYKYNDRLRYREPPYFLDPVQASWRISRETEQARPVMQR